MERYLCVHGHFYQPPRENPWLEEVEIQDSAHPYHDWNERVTRECYAPNVASRMVDGEGRILEIVNNYERLSFNLGPTLLSWMKSHAPETYASILAADALSRERRSGHGNAIAQAYNHLILPLASRRDKVTQVRWGIGDFEHRFGRRPEGMWLPETAVDLETLRLLAEEGIRFTILAPHQAARIRPLSGGKWIDVRGGRIDPSRPYRCLLPDGQSIALFFYDGPISQAIAFGGLLGSGERFVERLLSGSSAERDHPQLVHVATDGESYGHHHKFGEMALAYAFHQIESEGLAKLTNYGEFLEKFPPQCQVEIVEGSSWSCPHGVERWGSDCGCNMGRPGWHQRWRGPLREALEWLQERLDLLFEEKAGKLLQDPWAARDDYIQVLLDRSPAQVEAYFDRHQQRPLDHFERVDLLKLLEMERHSLLMFTSCGWFFDEISGTESVQILQYAAKAVQLARAFNRVNLEEELLKRLQAAPSNLPDLQDGAGVYRRLVLPSMVDLRRVIAHYAISSLFEEYEEEARIYCFAIRRLEYERASYGTTSLALGRLRIHSEITQEAEDVSFGLLHFGGHDFHCAVRGFVDLAGWELVREELARKFAQHSLTEVVRALDQHFEARYYTLKDLFLEKRRKILHLLTAETLKRFEEAYRRLYEENRRLMAYLREANAPLPAAFALAAKYVLEAEIEGAMERWAEDGPLPDRIFEMVQEASSLGLSLDLIAVELQLRRAVEAKLQALIEAPSREVALAALDLVKAAGRLSLPLDLWEAQNGYHRFLRTRPAPAGGPPQPEEEAFRSLGRRLLFHVEAQGSGIRGQQEPLLTTDP